MKNIHVLPTDKPSRLCLSNNSILTIVEEVNYTFSHIQSVNTYITSDEEIKDCWVLNTHINEVYFLKGYYGIQPIAKKIILTTDQDLIKDGVQSIDDEFLEWFVKNPNCEEVEVEQEKAIGYAGDRQRTFYGKYKITIPKEEHKRKIDTCYNFNIETGCVQTNCRCEKEEPKQERMYSEEEVLRIITSCKEYLSFGDEFNEKEWFKQFKKK